MRKKQCSGTSGCGAFQRYFASGKSGASESAVRISRIRMNARNLLFHLGRRIHCGAGLGRGKGGWIYPESTLSRLRQVFEVVVED